MSSPPQLRRRLGLADATFIGLGSMIGAGLFSAFTPAAQAAGAGLVVGLAIAAFVAFCNATSSAQLAAQYPSSGGSYLYGRERLGEWWGFAAGWSFVIGKTASCAAMALTFAAYAAPPGYERPIAVLAVLVLASVNYRGVTRTALLTRVIVVVVLLILVVVVAVVLGGSGARRVPLGEDWVSAGPWGILQAAGLLFFAFAGYARIATMGEEVREPARTIPRAITLALALTVLVYGIVALVLLSSLGAAGIAQTPTPLTEAVVTANEPWAVPLVQIGAAAAALGALLGLIAGIGRTSLAMAREGDLPRWLAAIHPRFQVPHRAEVVLALVVCVLVATVDLRDAIGFSSFGVLLYYVVANLAALTQTAAHRRYPRPLQVVGVITCLLLVVTLPLTSVLIGVGVLGVGLMGRVVVRTRRT